MNTITITATEYEVRTANVRLDQASSFVAARGAHHTEAELLLAFVKAEGIPKSIVDGDGDVWNLTSHDDSDECTYELATA